jgi:predicted transcriptional regulator
VSSVRDLDLDRRVLRALNRPGTVRDVAAETGDDSGAVSRAMRRLREIGLVRTVREQEGREAGVFAADKRQIEVLRRLVS